jgi:hypothetical protein
VPSEPCPTRASRIQELAGALIVRRGHGPVLAWLLLRRMADDIWVVERPQTFYGLPAGAGMTVIHLAGGACCCIRPFAGDPPFRAAPGAGCSGEGLLVVWLRIESIICMRARSFGLFHHGRSRTLVLCDFAFNFGPSSAFATSAAHEPDPELCGPDQARSAADP